MKMVDEFDVEDLVIQGIYILREKKRKRPTKKDLYFYVQEFYEDNSLDFNSFQETISKMEEKHLIFNKAKHGIESYYISKEFEKSILHTDSSFTKKTSFDVSKTPVLLSTQINTPHVKSTPLISQRLLNT